MISPMLMIDRPTPLREAVDRLFQSSRLPSLGNGGSRPLMSVPTNVWETDDSYQVALLLPGLDPGSIDITAVGNRITVTGVLEVNQPEGGRCIWQEFGPAEFHRQINLPIQVDSTRVETAYRNGVVLLAIPKTEQSRARKIKVETHQS